jgi:hypothetical protein
VYFRSILVVALCTAFVLSFAIVLSYEAAQVGQSGQVTLSTQDSCSPSEASCPSFTITSLKLSTANISSGLGPANRTDIALGLDVSGETTITKMNLFVGNSSGGTVHGPFAPGLNQVLNITLPSTVQVSPGTSYLVYVEGFSGSGSTYWASVRVTAD